MQFRQFCQPFLGKSALRPQFANAIAKCHARVRASHLKPMVKALNTMSLHTMSVIYKRGGPSRDREQVWRASEQSRWPVWVWKPVAGTPGRHAG
jgi:hypothetical protein